MNMHKKLNKDVEEIKPLDDSVVTWEEYRFTVLTDAMIRMEYSPTKEFVDRATKTVLNRQFPSVAFDLIETDKQIEIITSSVHLIFVKEKGGFTANNLTAQVIGSISTYHSSWHYGKTFETLKGTARTLDWVDGETPLEEGLMNKNGYALIDDSETVILTDDGWVEEKPKGHIDLYFLGYGRNYLQTLKDYFQLTGFPPIVPRYALGNWWSRFYPYSEETYMELMNRFKALDIPISVAVIDMDWHITDVPEEYGSGWTGYTWNRDLFPDPVRFLNWLHDEGMHTSLNLHPAQGVEPHEDAYEDMAHALGIDPSKKQGIEFDITEPDFMDAYFKHLHHPHEEDGVDFWWIDWQQGATSKIEGLDPLWMLNHFHYLDHGRDGKRPLIFSRYAGLGSHRYPIGFSGDTITTWESLDFQPYFTSTASNVGYTWWSHDIGGHMRGVKDRELYIRWLQYGVFSPINRLHSTGGKYNGKEPWRYGFEAQEIVDDYLRLRHQLVPYLYSMNVLTSHEGLPLVRPMYYHHPWKEEAYEVKNQYYFGTEMLVSPVTTKLIPLLQRSHAKTWLPQGTWYDFFTGMRYRGGRLMDAYRTLDAVPVFAKAGGIIPMDSTTQNSVDIPESLTVKVFAGADGHFTLYEDSGETAPFDGATTSMSLKWKEGSSSEFSIQKPEGDVSHLPEERQYTIEFVGFSSPSQPVITVKGKEVSATVENTEQGIRVRLPKASTDSDYTVIFKDIQLKENNVTEMIETLLDEAQIGFDIKEEIDRIVFEEGNKQVVLGHLLALDLETDLVKALSEILLAVPN
ncbi:glycoside hydrolase family 31 protein [Alkalibacterium iburiense]|uniref:Glycoside hydrolase family 31 protein n=2 Tax=Alkalibacterium iburiense TaxID=290589 RepID=A0ABP3H9Q6_9LACT